MGGWEEDHSRGDLPRSANADRQSTQTQATPPVRPPSTIIQHRSPSLNLQHTNHTSLSSNCCSDGRHWDDGHCDPGGEGVSARLATLLCPLRSLTHPLALFGPAVSSFCFRSRSVI